MRKRFDFSFLLFLLAALLLWYGNKLGGRFSTDVTLPLEIVNDYDASYWVEQSRLRVNATIEGTGTKLLKYKLGVAPAISLPMSKLITSPLRNGQRQVKLTNNAFGAVLAGQMEEVNLIRVLDTAIVVRVSAVESRRMAVISRLNIEPAREYLLVGAVRLSPDSITVRGPKVILDSIGAGVHTKAKSYRRQKLSLSGRIELDPVEYLLYSQRRVEFQAEITPYTEQRVELPVEVANLPEGLQALTLPATVKALLQIPPDRLDELQRRAPRASINYLKCVESPRRNDLVQIDSLPRGARVVLITPPSAELFLTQ